MNLKELTQYFVSELGTRYDKEEAMAIGYVLLEHFGGLSRGQVMMNPAMEISEEQLSVYTAGISGLKSGKPLQHLIGETLFYGLPFRVNANVLIPRPETEELVDWILQVINEPDMPISILDIGTGSGCISVSLKYNLKNSAVAALDVSAAALAVARDNAERNGTVIDFIEADILHYRTDRKYDLLVSNPPYIKEDERPDMQEHVLAHEPHLALFVTNERPLIFYEAIADFALLHLSPAGHLFFEINEYLGLETVTMLEEKGFHSVVLKKDMQGKDRMIYCRTARL